MQAPGQTVGPKSPHTLHCTSQEHVQRQQWPQSEVLRPGWVGGGVPGVGDAQGRAELRWAERREPGGPGVELWSCIEQGREGVPRNEMGCQQGPLHTGSGWMLRA